MEKQGIITGIGNEITPEIDAVLNNFIVGENAIIRGLDWSGNTLNAGMCQLCGYRGVLEQEIPNISNVYVYGKFEINFEKDIEDNFSIVTADIVPTDGTINPTSITSAGIYYLRLYTNKATTLPTYKYPKHAHISDRAKKLIANGTIDKTATTQFADNEVNVHETQPNRVASTKYVHNQIVAEIDEGTYSNTFSVINGSLRVVLERRAKFVIGQIGNADASLDDTPNTFSINLPYGFKPNKDISARVAIGTRKFILGAGDGRQAVISTYQINMATSGEVTFTLLASTDVYSSGNVSINVIGYECQ